MRRNDLWFHTMMWSRRSRRIEPTSRSTYGFCQGDRGAVSALIGHHKEGFLFRTYTGRPLSARNVLRDSLHPTLLALKQPKMGFHCFRRFRESVLQKSEARALLIDYWMGHENQDMGTRYGQQLLKDVEWRKEWAEKDRPRFQIDEPGTANWPTWPTFQVKNSARESGING